MLVLKLVALTSCLLGMSQASPQLFPFSNVKKYFEHQSKAAPSTNEKRNIKPEAKATSPLLPTQLPKLDKYFDEHRLDSEETGPFGVYAPKPVHTLSAPNQAPAFSYAGFYDTLTKPNTPISQSPLQPEDFIDILRENPKTNQPQTLPGQQGGLEFIPTRLGNPSLGLFTPNTGAGLYSTKPPVKYIAKGGAGFTNQPSNLFTANVGTGLYNTQNGQYAPAPTLLTKPVGGSFTKGQYEPVPTLLTKPVGGSFTNSQYAPAPTLLTKSGGEGYKNGASAYKYPKKYESEEVYLKKKKNSPKTDNKLRKQQEQQSGILVSKTINAANFQEGGETSLPYKTYQSRPTVNEQITAESGFAGIAAGAGGFGGGDFGGGGLHHGGGGGGGGERVEFQMHGHQGPSSYKFGYDTGKGHNRQFRYEERDGHGHVKGHYGFYDKSGKLQHVHYSADDHGFHAGGNFGDRSLQ